MIQGYDALARNEVCDATSLAQRGQARVQNPSQIIRHEQGVRGSMMSMAPLPVTLLRGLLCSLYPFHYCFLVRAQWHPG
eukprot:scaffold567_cov384-Prasinococcus_capsulatus_cf.AAC.8